MGRTIECWGVCVAVALGCGGCPSDDRPNETGDASATTTLSPWDTTGGDSGSGGASSEGSLTSSSGSSSGTSITAGVDTDESCAEIQVTLETIIPTVVLLVDRSGSMEDPFGDTIRWAAVYDALMNETTGVVTNLADRIRFGLTLYTAPPANSGLECPDLIKVSPALDNRDAIDQIYSEAGPGGRTPTGPSLQVTADELAALELEGPKVIVLATDGEPNSCVADDGTDGRAVSLAAAEHAFDLGIRMYILSVGTDVGAEHLQEMANLGVGKPIDDPMPAPYYQATNPDELVADFGQIIGDLVSCDLILQGEVDLDEACSGTVMLDGQELECGTQWELLDAMTLRLLGDACETLRDGSQHEVSASFPCGTVVIP